MAPMAPPSADTASYWKHISDIDSTFGTGVRLKLCCIFMATLQTVPDLRKASVPQTFT